MCGIFFWACGAGLPKIERFEDVRRAIVATLLVTFGGAVVFGGCATAPEGPSDEELIAQVAEGMAANLAAIDLDKLMTFYSEDFENWEWGDKAGLKAFIKEAIEDGYLEDIEVDMEKAKTTIEGDKATVYPIEITASFGGATAEIELKKEGCAWLIVAMDLQMY